MGGRAACPAQRKPPSAPGKPDLPGSPPPELQDSEFGVGTWLPGHSWLSSPLGVSAGFAVKGERAARRGWRAAWVPASGVGRDPLFPRP